MKLKFPTLVLMLVLSGSALAQNNEPQMSNNPMSRVLSLKYDIPIYSVHILKEDNKSLVRRVNYSGKSMRLNISPLSTGVYTLKLYTRNMIFLRRIVKL